MSQQNPIQKLAVLLLICLGFLVNPLAVAAENPFTSNSKTDSAVVVGQAEDDEEEGQSGEGDEGDEEDAGEEAKCGGEGKCGEGKCGG